VNVGKLAHEMAATYDGRMNEETLAHKLGTTAHISPLLMKARRLGLHGVEELKRLAVERGCSYYNVVPTDNVLREEPLLRVSRADFSNAELAIALLSFSPVNLLRQRMGAAMLSAPDVEVTSLATLAVAEGCGGIVHYIADCGHAVEPENDYWMRLRSELSTHAYEATEMPHPTRFIEMTGVSRGKIGIEKHWVRPIHALALAG